MTNLSNKRYIVQRLDYLRSQIKSEKISYSEIAELQSYAEYIKDDPLLAEWAGLCEQHSVLDCTECNIE